MKRIYIVVGEIEDTDMIDRIDGAYTSMERAEERCAELENQDGAYLWYWREVVLEEEGDKK